MPDAPTGNTPPADTAAATPPATPPADPAAATPPATPATPPADPPAAGTPPADAPKAPAAPDREAIATEVRTEYQRLHTEQVAAWEAAAKADKDIGGDKFAENLAVAKKGLETFFPGVKDLLGQFGFGSHPEVIRGFVKLGQLVSEDKFVGGDGGSPPAKKPFYENSNMNP